MIFDMPSCGGCRSCEMACSFHHVGAFGSSISSLRILDKEGGAGFRVSLLEEANDLGRACDSCEGLQVPLCVEYCRESQILTQILDEFRGKAGPRAILQKGAQDGEGRRPLRVGRQDPAG